MRKPIAVLSYLLSIHLLALIILTLLRFALYFSNTDQVADIKNKG